MWSFQLGETEKERGNYNMYGKFCGRRTIEGHGELSFSKDILNVCHKPGKVLGTRGCSSEHIKDKNVFTWGKEGTQT